MFQPVVPFGGYAGWSFLTRTLEKQQETFANAPGIERDTAYFRKHIGRVNNAAELVSNHTLLKVALGAFGLDNDINSKAFIRKILTEGTLAPKALANRLSDKRYLELSKAFGFGDLAVPRNKISDFAEKITSLYVTRQFEIAVEQQNPDMRLALSLERDLAEISGKNSGENTKWYEIMGRPPLRKVFETAFGLPSSFAAINLDTQLKTFKDRAEQAFGSSNISRFTDPSERERLIRLFLLRANLQTQNALVQGSQAALLLLQRVPQRTF